jgi:flagellar hook-associated protein 1
MSSLFGTLSNAAQSLATQSAGVQLAGKNIANASTDGYAKQELVIHSLGTAETPIGPQTVGYEAASIKQVRDKYLDAEVTREQSRTGYLQAQEDSLSKAQEDIGEQITNSGSASSISDTYSPTTGIGASISDFFTAVSSLAASPTDSGAKQVLLQKADLLANQINVADDRLDSLQTDITNQNADDLVTTNNLLEQVGNLNQQIQKFEAGDGNAGTAVDLRDQRETALEKLSNYIDFTTQDISDSPGKVEIISKDSSGNDVVLVDKSGVQGAITADSDGAVFSGGNPSTELALTGGSIQGNVEARDGAIQEFRDNLKSLATQLTTSVNSAYNSYGSNGDFFDPSPSSGLIAVDSSLTSSTLQVSSNGNAGDNKIALAVAAVADEKYATPGDSIDGTISGFYSKIASGLGETISATKTKLSDQQSVQTLVTNRRNGDSSVSQDDELTDLVKYQRGFQASSKVINVVDDLLDTVVNGLIK